MLYIGGTKVILSSGLDVMKASTVNRWDISILSLVQPTFTKEGIIYKGIIYKHHSVLEFGEKKYVLLWCCFN